MKSPVEYFDALVSAQKQLIGNMELAQKDLQAQMMDVVTKTTASIAALPGMSEIPAAKIALSQVNTWLNTAANNAEALKFQADLRSAYDNQLASTRAVMNKMLSVLSVA